jgi:hypothetical protein
MKKVIFTLLTLCAFVANVNAGGYFGLKTGQAFVKINGTTYNITSGSSITLNAPITIQNVFVQTEKWVYGGGTSNACGGTMSWSGTGVISGSSALSYDGGFTEYQSGNNQIQQWTSAPAVVAITAPGSHTINFALALTGNDNGSSGCATTVNVNFSQTILPIELKSLNVEAKGNATFLKWVTASEHENASFEIERSSNGFDFTSIGNQKGAGNSFQEKTYSFVDKSPFQGINYYRLRSISYNGVSDFTKIVSIRFGKNSHFIAYPNPATSTLNLEYNAEKDASSVNIQVFDMYGKLQQSELIDLSEGINVLPLQVDQLAIGSYIVKIGETVVRFEKK